MAFFQSTPPNHRSGFVALIGRPNVGKSTLVNCLIGEKVAITSPVAQTTRNRLKAILTTSDSQIVFVDTPGIHKPHHLLGERLVKSARSTIGEVDLIVLMFDGSELPGKGDAFIVDLLKRQKLPVLAVLNKWDLVSEKERSNFFDFYQRIMSDTSWPIYICSAVQGDGCKEVINAISKKLPIGPQLYPPDMISDQPENLLLAELIREQVLLHTREEIPHSVAVKIERVEDIRRKNTNKGKPEHTGVLATVFVERKSQKGILIGKGGSMLKAIGKAARLQMQNLINGPVYLELFVKIVPAWRSKASLLSELGYKEV
ncbi:GTPase Era [Prochlorococcus sp. MIT 1341]|uniref:GTPase Era n=1 Tax=Prochlorococcus sp. MIT 1341 TaxID=3096221 RepID=UPI002A76534F|nr:GTPase Era [Prochlorococcus sp. MIT 1341]